MTKERGDQVLDALDVDYETLSSKEEAALQALVMEYADVFALDSSELGATDLVQHVIDTGDNPPIHQPARRIPFALRDKVEQLVDDMLNQGVVVPSKSPWASPVVLVAKRDGTVRFCVDYRRLNAATKMDVYPLPRVDDQLDLLSRSRYFTTLDLATGYWQVSMAPESQEKTAFITHSGLYEFTVMPFGLCNAPATFQRLMETVLAGLARTSCMVYIDDILVVGETFEDHLLNLRKVFDRLREAGLRLKPTKCHLAKPKVEYLGYIVSAQGIAADPKKVEAIKSFPVPANLKNLRLFLGLASYYRRFIPRFAAEANPLHALTRKDVPFIWDTACQKAFEHLKQLMTEAPLLAFPDFRQSFLLETDASGLGLGAVLSQKQEDGTIRPLAFASRTLQTHERNYGVTELEALGVVWAVKHFRPYLYGHHCDVYTDHEALRSLLNTPHPSGKLARWGLALQELELQIHYRPGKRNANADALSRSPLQDEESASGSNLSDVIGTVGVVQPEYHLQPSKDGDNSLETRQRADPDLALIFAYLEEATLPEDTKKARELVLSRNHYEVLDRVLYHLEPDKTLRVIPPEVDRKKIFDEAHSGPFGGHLRETKIHGQLARHYWWPRMRADIAKWCRACVTCASRRVGQASKPPLNPIPVSGPFNLVGVDVIKFPKSQKGNQYAVVFMDYLTKWPEVFPTRDQTSLTIARLLVEHVVSRHGVPTGLLSDRGAAFLSNMMHEVYQLLGMRKVNTTAYHPQTDGLVERFNRTLTDMLAKKVKKSGRDWDVQLPYVLFAYRTSMQESTRESPFFLLYGRDPRLPTEVALSPSPEDQNMDVDDYKAELVTGLSTAWEAARRNVERAQQKQKKFFDRRARDPGFRVGDRVFLYVPSEKSGQAYKFAKPYRGPYRIVGLYENGADLRLVSRPGDQTIRVALTRLRRCPEEIGDPSWPATEAECLAPSVESENSRDDPPEVAEQDETPSVWRGRLRPREKLSEDACNKDRDM